MLTFLPPPALSDAALNAARVQMGLTLGFHIILACYGIGIPLLLLFADWRHVKTGDTVWRALAQRWAKAFAVLFAVGAVSGTVLSFELGLLWPEWMGRYSAVFGPLFALEGYMFFLEAIFVGIFIYGWDRMSPRVHMLSAIPIAVSGAMSAFFVMGVNAWMQAPAEGSFTVVDGKITEIDPWAVMFGPTVAAQVLHMLIAAYMVTGFSVAAVYAFYWLRGDRTVYVRRALALGLAMGFIAAPLQALTGDYSAKVVAHYEPAKLAAMEAQFETEKGAPLRIGGIPDEEAGETSWAIEIPGLLSFLAHGDFNAEVIGLKDIPRDEWPPIWPVHYSFQIMVGIGFALLGLGVFTVIYLWRRRRMPTQRWYLYLVIASGPLAVLAMQLGWMVTEIGRQPWIVYGKMRTAEAVTEVAATGWLLAASIVIYGIIGVGAVLVLKILARQPLPEDARAEIDAEASAEEGAA